MPVVELPLIPLLFGADTMPEEHLTLDEIRRMAEEIGMTRLTDEHMQQLLRAAKLARARRATLSLADLGPADEPAHVFRLADDSMKAEAGK
jgi:hypothetical protein